MRFRNAYVIFGSILTLILLVITDPDAHLVQGLNIGAGTVTSLVYLFKGILGAALLFVTGKAMMDYFVADFEELGKNANRTPEGAGLYAIAVSLKWIAFAIIIAAAFNV